MIIESKWQQAFSRGWSEYWREKAIPKTPPSHPHTFKEPPSLTYHKGSRSIDVNWVDIRTRKRSDGQDLWTSLSPWPCPQKTFSMTFQMWPEQPHEDRGTPGKHQESSFHGTEQAISALLLGETGCGPHLSICLQETVGKLYYLCVYISSLWFPQGCDDNEIRQNMKKSPEECMDDCYSWEWGEL